jgi:hypothetical protein
MLALIALAGLVAAGPVVDMSPETVSRSVALNSLGGVGADVPHYKSSTVAGERCLTNADCLARGKPILKPRLRARNKTLRPRQSNAPPM